MEIYHYHPETGQLLGCGQASKSPLDNAWLIPRHATDTAPPEPGENQAPVFDAQAGTWSLVPDFRGRRYWSADGAAHEITALGAEIPAGAITEAPPTDMAAPEYKDGQWIETDAGVDKKRQKEILAAWPVTAQLEALVENALGRPEKLNALAAHIDAAKAKHPKSNKN